MSGKSEHRDDLLERSSESVQSRLRALDVDALPIDAFYRGRYLKDKLSYLESAAIRAVAQLRMALNDLPDLGEMVLVDHGGGTGMTGMLAKLAGVGTVIYNDIDSKMLDTAQCVAVATGAPSDHYVLGGFDALTAYLGEMGVRCTTLVSYDVIEHVYDMDEFIAALGRLPGARHAVLMSSGANLFSPRCLLSTIPIQRRAERESKTMCRGIVRELAPDVSADEGDRLAAATRGCIRAGIEQIVRHCRETGSIRRNVLSGVNRFDPYGTNTCHPETGWWAEHFMNPWYLRRRLAEEEFEAVVEMGRYGRPTGVAKRAGAQAINSLIRLAGPAGIVLAAYYTLRARRAGPGKD